MAKEIQEYVKRKSMLENIDFHIDRNLYCERKSLINEASVESFFVLPFLYDLGFKEKNIKTKESIDKLQIAKGHKKILYKPDYASGVVPILMESMYASGTCTNGPNNQAENAYLAIQVADLSALYSTPFGIE